MERPVHQSELIPAPGAPLYGERFFFVLFSLLQGGAVKVITDGEGQMLGLTASVVTDLPEPEAGTPSLTAQQAEVIYSDMGSAGADGHSIRMMSRPGRTIPLLVYLSMKPGDAEIEQMKYLCHLNGRWFDLSGFIHDITDRDNPLEREEIVSRIIEGELFAEAMRAFSSSSSLSGLLNALALDVKGGQTYEIPVTGLESVELTTGFTFGAVQTDTNQNKKSRPKELTE